MKDNTQRTVLTKPEAFPLLKPLFEEFLAIQEKSFDSVMNWMNSDRAQGYGTHLPHVIANVMYNYQVNHALQTFKDNPKYPHIKPVVYNRLFGLSYHDAMFIRFKKLDLYTLRPTNKETKQSKAVNEQCTCANFPENPFIVTVGFTTDGTWTDLHGQYVVCTGKSDNHWSINMRQEVDVLGELDYSLEEEKLSYTVETLLKIKTVNG